MSDNSFALIAQEIQKQKLMMEALESENQSLRRQIAEIHEGRGIFIEIDGKRIALRSTTPPPITTTTTITTPYAVSSAQAAQTRQEVTRTEVPALATTTTETAHTALKDEIEGETASAANQPQTQAPTFLEEIMLSEFESALTSPLPLRKAAPTEEEQKATLRRELMGSFLLE